jgi:hypothetical protein
MIHFGKISDDHLVALGNLLADLELPDTSAKLFLLHHHPVSYSNPTAGQPDFSQLANAEQLFNILCQHQFDLVVHGHTHQPRFRPHALDAAQPIGILASGSLSLALPRAWEGSVSNQFHLLEVHGRDPTTRYLQGIVRSWAYFCGPGWVQSSRERDGIAANEPFGLYDAPQVLRRSLRAALQQLFADREWISHEQLEASLPDLKYARPERIVDELRAIAAEEHYLLHDSVWHRLVILRSNNHG